MSGLASWFEFGYSTADSNHDCHDAAALAKFAREGSRASSEDRREQHGNRFLDAPELFEGCCVEDDDNNNNNYSSWSPRQKNKNTQRQFAIDADCEDLISSPKRRNRFTDQKTTKKEDEDEEEEKEGRGRTNDVVYVTGREIFNNIQQKSSLSSSFFASIPTSSTFSSSSLQSFSSSSLFFQRAAASTTCVFLPCYSQQYQQQQQSFRQVTCVFGGFAPSASSQQAKLFSFTSASAFSSSNFGSSSTSTTSRVSVLGDLNLLSLTQHHISSIQQRHSSSSSSSPSPRYGACFQACCPNSTQTTRGRDNINNEQHVILFGGTCQESFPAANYDQMLDPSCFLKRDVWLLSLSPSSPSPSSSSSAIEVCWRRVEIESENFCALSSICFSSCVFHRRYIQYQQDEEESSSSSSSSQGKNEEIVCFEFLHFGGFRLRSSSSSSQEVEVSNDLHLITFTLHSSALANRVFAKSQMLTKFDSYPSPRAGHCFVAIPDSSLFVLSFGYGVVSQEQKKLHEETQQQQQQSVNKGNSSIGKKKQNLYSGLESDEDEDEDDENDNSLVGDNNNNNENQSTIIGYLSDAFIFDSSSFCFKSISREGNRQSNIMLTTPRAFATSFCVENSSVLLETEQQKQEENNVKNIRSVQVVVAGGETNGTSNEPHCSVNSVLGINLVLYHHHHHQEQNRKKKKKQNQKRIKNENVHARFSGIRPVLNIVGMSAASSVGARHSSFLSSLIIIEKEQEQNERMMKRNSSIKNKSILLLGGFGVFSQHERNQHQSHQQQNPQQDEQRLITCLRYSNLQQQQQQQHSTSGIDSSSSPPLLLHALAGRFLASAKFRS